MKKQDVQLLGHAMVLSNISQTPPRRHSNTPPRSRGRGRARARTRQNSNRESSAATCCRESVALTPPPDQRGDKSEDLVRQATAEVTGNPSQSPKTEHYGSPTASASQGDKEKESGTTTSGGQDVQAAQLHSETAKETASEEAGCAKRVRIARTDQGGGPPSSVPSLLRNERKDANCMEMRMNRSPPALPQENPATSSVSPSGESEKMADEDSTPHSQSSRSSTPNVSNPGTPRQELAPEVRATPPLAVPSTSSTIQRTIPGQPQPPSAAAIAAAASAAATAAAMAIPPQQQGAHVIPPQSQSKYSSLLAVIEDMGRDIRPTYAGNRTSSERLKRSIVHARILVRECLMECERSART